MRVPGSVLFVATALVAACNSKTTPAPNNATQAGALEVYRDGCDADACSARPPPQHRCAGGYAVTVCTAARGTCGWQVDCADEPPPDYDGNVSVTSCDGAGTTVEACGPLPTYDEKDCVYGFIGEPQCESYGGAPCAWSHRCRPQPCEQRGTCNTFDRSKLGEPCDALSDPCPSGSTCASVFVNLGETIPPTCIAGNPCDALTCNDGLTCTVAESYPAQVRCSR